MSPRRSVSRVSRVVVSFFCLIRTNNELSLFINYNLAFFPQPFWLLMILAPNWSFTNKVIKKESTITTQYAMLTELNVQILKPWWSVVAFSLVHLFIVVVSASQTDGTAPLAEFAGVFDPSGDPQEVSLRSDYVSLSSKLAVTL